MFFFFFFEYEELAEISNEELLREIPLLTLIGHGFIRRLANQMQAGPRVHNLQPRGDFFLRVSAEFVGVRRTEGRMFWMKVWRE